MECIGVEPIFPRGDVMHSELKYWVWLSMLEGISPRRKNILLEHFRDPAYIWEAGEAELKASGLCSPKVIRSLTDRDARKNTDAAMEIIKRCDAEAVTINDKCYPSALKYIADPPIVLYLRGKLKHDEMCIAVVGSRRATWYGLDMAKRLSRELAGHGITVVSGMARGIDSQAHNGALEGGGRTIAVLGCGVDRAYPPENRELMDRIIKNGAVVSEYLPGTKPMSYNFPARNRIISGLSRGVAVVEASEKSGSLITADFALEQGRDVFAVPGNINSTYSIGTNRLIREGAKIVTCVGDILEELDMETTTDDMDYSVRKSRCTELTGDEKSIAQRLMSGPVHIDAIARDCGLSIAVASSVLVMLELSGFVEQLPGKFYKLSE
jgi:DNA processing protein